MGENRVVMLVDRPPADRRARRYVQLLLGVALFGFSNALMLRGALGVDPWDVLHQGLSRALGLPVGTCTIVVGALVLAGWLPLRQRLGLGTLVNAVFVGLVINVTLDAIPVLRGVSLRCGALFAGVMLNGIATGVYIGAGLGAGPRDGLMTAFASRGRSIRVVRTCIELTVLTVGWALGGNVGIGTLIYALCIGPIVHVTVPAFSLPAEPARTRPDDVLSSACPRARTREPPRLDCHMTQTIASDGSDVRAKPPTGGWPTNASAVTSPAR